MRGAYRKRLVYLPPDHSSFKPAGIPSRLLKKITLSVDEYEAVRLADYEGQEHARAAESMAISRPTFTRLVEKARNKIARALVDGMELVVEGGNIEFANTRRRCRNCGHEKIEPIDTKVDDCPECGSENVEDQVKKFTD